MMALNSIIDQWQISPDCFCIIKELTEKNVVYVFKLIENHHIDGAFDDEKMNERHWIKLLTLFHIYIN